MDKGGRINETKLFTDDLLSTLKNAATTDGDQVEVRKPKEHGALQNLRIDYPSHGFNVNSSMSSTSPEYFEYSYRYGPMRMNQENRCDSVAIGYINHMQ
jgi:hypothetical protein